MALPFPYPAEQTDRKIRMVPAKPQTEDPSPAEFRAAMRRFVGNCSLITAGSGAARNGLVVTSALSLSADPPLILACINRASSSWQLLKTAGCFGLSSLGAGHRAVAERFSGQAGHQGAARFDGLDWVSAVTGAPLLADAVVGFDCSVEEMLDRASHSILIGRIRAIRTTTGQGALIYWDGAYHSLKG